MTITRRDFLGYSSLLLAACGAPTPAVADDDDFPPRCGPATADNIEGPFYKAGAPHRAILATPKDAGVPFAVSGTVMSTACEPIANAELDIWQANAKGEYDNDGFRFRGALVTDAKGRWQLRTIIPGRYLNGSTYRPAHIHVKVRAPDRVELTTQLYFAGDPYNAKDPWIVDSLVMKHHDVKGVRRAAFDFVIA
jgi:protocatechuate 3,4-dioxygenase beta subunit